MAEACPRSGRKDRSHPTSPSADAPVTDLVDATLKPVKPPALYPSLNRSFPHAHRAELGPCHHPVLALRKLSDLLIPIASRHFPLYMTGNCRLVFHAPEAEANRRTGGAQIVPASKRDCAQNAKRPQPAVAASSFDPFK